MCEIPRDDINKSYTGRDVDIYDCSHFKLYDYISDLCHPSYHKNALDPSFYKRVNFGNTYRVYELFPMQHMFGDIYILKTVLSETEKRALSKFSLIKRLPSMLSRVGVTEIPERFEDWPYEFTLLEDRDNLETLKDKFIAVQECLKKSISFVKKWVYGGGSLRHKFLRRHCDFVVNLHIISVKLEALI